MEISFLSINNILSFVFEKLDFLYEVLIQHLKPRNFIVCSTKRIRLKRREAKVVFLIIRNDLYFSKI